VVAVTAGGGCSWTAGSNVAWIAIVSGAAGTGNGSVSYTVAPNTDRTSRTGVLSVAGRTLTVTQFGTCSFTLTPSSLSFPLGGGRTSIAVAAQDASCTWRAVSSVPWASIDSGGQGLGSGSFNLDIAANAGPGVRTAVISVEDQTVQVIQAGPTVMTLDLPALAAVSGPATRLDDSRYTGLALVNMDPNATAVLTLTAIDGSGAKIAGADIQNPTTTSLAPGQQKAFVVTELFGQGLAAKNSSGWVRIESTVSRLLSFFLLFNGSLGVLDGADVSSASSASVVLPAVDGGGTEYHVANPNSTQLTVAAELVKADGNLRVPGVSRTIPAGGILSAPVEGLFPGIAADASDYVRIRGNERLAALQVLGKSGQYLEVLNGQDATGGTTTLYSPQYVTGGGWRSTLSVVNLSPAAGTIRFELIGDNGVPLGAPQTRAIPANGKVHVSSQDFFGNFGSQLTQGYVRITSDGPRLCGSVVFGDPAYSTFASALPLASVLQSSVVFSQVASDDTWFTGLAMLNPTDIRVTARIIVRDETGRLVIEKTEDLAPRQRRSALLTEFFPELVGRTIRGGYIQVISTERIASFGLYGTGDLSVLSAVPPQVAP